MILNEIILTNFGVFRGEHRAILTPPSDDQPVVLFGGMNGGGKTTVLEAIQLALYGKMADTSRQNGWSYEEYLQRSIHRGVSRSDGASVELAFTVQEDGALRQYRTRRTWSMPGSRIKEYLDVFVDGQRDDLLSGTWQEQVERFIPSKLAPLFFFDGERIETLADPDQSAAVLTKAIYALLGVDLVDQLSVDLQAIERRKRKDAVDTIDRQEIDLLEQELQQATERLTTSRTPFGCDRIYHSADNEALFRLRSFADGTQVKLSIDEKAVIEKFKTKSHFKKQKEYKPFIAPGDSARRLRNARTSRSLGLAFNRLIRAIRFAVLSFGVFGAY
jgi:DNA sulfur modification protein DndD